MLFSVLFFLAGIFVVQQLPALPSFFWLLSLVLFSLGLAFFRYWKSTCFTIGMLWAIFFAHHRIADRLSSSLEKQNIAIVGEVIGIPQQDDKKVSFDFAISTPSALPKKIRLSWYFPKKNIKAGQRWQFTVKLKKPHGRFNPNAFDYERWLFINHIGATGYVKNTPKPQIISTRPWWKSISVVRQKIADNLENLPLPSQFIGVIKALTIGERQDLTQQQWDVFRQTGTVHLLAISGLHIGLVSGLIYFLALRIGIGLSFISPQKTAAFSAILIAFFYSALAGFSLPTQRSLLMLSIAMIAMTWQRNITSSNTLALTLLGVLLYDPFSVLSAGFWLSFLAVIVIIYSLAGRLGKSTYWLSATKIHWVTALALAPVVLFYFQQVSIISPLSNFFTVPIISLMVVPLCLLGVLSMLFSTALATQLFLLVDTILQGLWLFLSEIIKFPYTTVNLSQPSAFSIPIAMLGVFILLAPRGLPARWLGIVLFIPLLFIKVDKPALNEITLTLLDVGQGLATVIETNTHVLVFDSGAKYSNKYDMGDTVVLPFLKNKGINIIDTLLISHGDNDHIGGAESLIKKSNVKQILTSTPSAIARHEAIKCQAGQAWTWDHVIFEILSPIKGVLEGDNNNSCVLKISSIYGSILLTGDIEKPAENWLLNHATTQQLKSDILIAPHHGSKSSSTLSFLKQVDPTNILIPAGYKNKYSFPHKEVLDRYRQLNIKWRNTANEGAIIVEIKKESLSIKSTYSNQKKYWH